MKLLFGLVKWAIASIMILVAGHLVQWDGISVSEQVRRQMGLAEKWGSALLNQGRAPVEGIRDQLNRIEIKTTQSKAQSSRPLSEIRRVEDLTASERTKLKELIEQMKD